MTKNHSHLGGVSVLGAALLASSCAATRPAQAPPTAPPVARTADEWFAVAGAATRAYDFAGCVDAATRAAALATAPAEASLWRAAALTAAKCAEADGDREAARRWLVRVSDAAGPSDAAEGWRARAALEERAAAWPAAEAAWRQVLALQPAEAGVRLALARVQAAQGELQPAADCALGYLALDLRTGAAVSASERVTAALAAWPAARSADYAGSLRRYLRERAGLADPRDACTAPWLALVAAGHAEAFAQGVARLAGSVDAEAWWDAHATEVAALEQAMAAASPPR